MRVFLNEGRPSRTKKRLRRLYFKKMQKSASKKNAISQQIITHRLSQSASADHVHNVISISTEDRGNILPNPAWPSPAQFPNNEVNNSLILSSFNKEKMVSDVHKKYMDKISGKIVFPRNGNEKTVYLQLTLMAYDASRSGTLEQLQAVVFLLAEYLLMEDASSKTYLSKVAGRDKKSFSTIHFSVSSVKEIALSVFWLALSGKLLISLFD